VIKQSYKCAATINRLTSSNAKHYTSKEKGYKFFLQQKLRRGPPYSIPPT